MVPFPGRSGAAARSVGCTVTSSQELLREGRAAWGPGGRGLSRGWRSASEWPVAWTGRPVAMMWGEHFTLLFLPKTRSPGSTVEGLCPRAEPFKVSRSSQTKEDRNCHGQEEPQDGRRVSGTGRPGTRPRTGNGHEVKLRDSVHFHHS